MREHLIDFYVEAAFQSIKIRAEGNPRLFSSLAYDEKVITQYRNKAVADGYTTTDFYGAFERLRRSHLLLLDRNSFCP